MRNQDTPKRTQVERTRQSKSRILQEACRLFGEHGYSGTRMADIANAAGLTLPGLLHHFPGKQDLLTALLESRDRADQQHYEGVFAASAGTNALDALSALVEYNQTVPEVIRIYTVLAAESTSPGHPGHDYFVQRYRFFRQQYLAALQDAQAQGRLRPDVDVTRIGMLVMAVMDGLQLQWLLDPDEVDMAAAFKMFTQIFGNGLQDKPAGSE